jgi:hypothetical protein
MATRKIRNFPRGQPIFSRGRTMTRKYANKVIAVYLKASNDRNGNPQRGWKVYSKDGDWIGFVDEGYGGRGSLMTLFPKAVELGPIRIDARTYRESQSGRIRDGRRAGW